MVWKAESSSGSSIRMVFLDLELHEEEIQCKIKEFHLSSHLLTFLIQKALFTYQSSTASLFDQQLKILHQNEMPWMRCTIRLRWSLFPACTSSPMDWISSMGSQKIIYSSSFSPASCCFSSHATWSTLLFNSTFRSWRSLASASFPLSSYCAWHLPSCMQDLLFSFSLTKSLSLWFVSSTSPSKPSHSPCSSTIVIFLRTMRSP